MPGVSSCSVNLLAELLTVHGDFDEVKLYEAIKHSGYELVRNADLPETLEKDTYLKRQLLYFVISFVLSVYIMLNARLGIVGNGKVAILSSFFACFAILILNRKFYVNGIKGILAKSPNMDTLVCTGSGISFLYGLFLLGQALIGEFTGEGLMYFESAGMIVTFVSVGKYLEERAKGKTKNAVEGLRKLIPDTANVIARKNTDAEGDVLDIRNCPVRKVPVAKVGVDDILVVKSGEYFPSDGVVLEGNAVVNEAALTGESKFVRKAAGDNVFTGTVNENGCLYVRVTKEIKDTTLSRIIDMCETAASSKAPIARIADKAASVFVPCVIGIAGLTFLLWLVVGKTDVSVALFYAVSVLVVSCPCAMGLATPVAIMVATGVGARNGILFKEASTIENLSKIKSIVFDKTGTMTEGRPKITEVYIRNENSFERIKLEDCAVKYPQFVKYLYSIEKVSEHPLGVGICESIESVCDVAAMELSNVDVVRARGVIAEDNGKTIICGSLALIGEYVPIGAEVTSLLNTIAKSGKTPVILAEDGKILGIAALSDEPRKNAIDLVSRLRARGLCVSMLTGDNLKTANAVADVIGISEVKAEVLPDEKAVYVNALKQDGLLAMVGDGINDSVALTEADVGIVMREGSDIAIDSADIVLTGNDLMKIDLAIDLSKRTVKIIKENLAWACIYNVVGIPLAAGVYGYRLPPYFAALAMGLSSFCVVCNALRINKFNVKEQTNMVNRKMVVEGMMCEHCEARVKAALEGIAGVEKASPSHSSNSVDIVVAEDVSDEILKEVVENQGYKVMGIE